MGWERWQQGKGWPRPSCPPLTPSTAPLRGLPAPRPSQKGSVGSAAAPQDADVGCCPALRPPRCRGGAGDATGRREGTATQMGTRRPHISQQGGQRWPQIHPPPPPSQRDTGTRFARWGSRLPHARRAGGFAHTQTWGSGDVPPIALTDSCTHTLHSPGLCLSLAHTHTQRGLPPLHTHHRGAHPLLPSPLLPPSLARSHTRTALSHTPSPPPPYKSPPSPSCSC